MMRPTAQTHDKYVLKGRIVQMTNEQSVIDDGRLVVAGNVIKAVLGPGDSLPPGFVGCLEIDTGGTIYPGLIDLHNHYTYNVLELWQVPKRFDNRSQWPRRKTYVTGVSRPIKRFLAEYSPSARAVVRYVECKALIGGTTTGQGILTAIKGGSRRVYKGLMRNVEGPLNDDLPRARTRVGDLEDGEDPVDAFKRALEDTAERDASYFYHLAEGVDGASYEHFENLVKHKLVQSSLVAIHALALKSGDHKLLAKAGVGLVWSPLSNLLLYGKTLDTNALKSSGIDFAIGCDWSPTGSKNLLEELKVAKLENASQEGPFTSYDLVNAVTAQAAKVTGWLEWVGTLEAGKLADIVVIAGLGGEDPYEQLVGATEADVSLVVVDGIARYGDLELLGELVPNATEVWDQDGIGSTKAFHLQDHHSPLKELSLGAARELLTSALKDLPAFKRSMERERNRFGILTVDDEPFTLVVDEHDEQDPLTEYGQMRPSKVPAGAVDKCLVLDAPSVDAAHLNRLERQQNLPDELAAKIAAYYRR